MAKQSATPAEEGRIGLGDRLGSFDEVVDKFSEGLYQPAPEEENQIVRQHNGTKSLWPYLLSVLEITGLKVFFTFKPHFFRLLERFS